MFNDPYQDQAERLRFFSLILKQTPVAIQSIPTLTILNASFQNGTATSPGLLKLRDDDLLLTGPCGKVR